MIRLPLFEDDGAIDYAFMRLMYRLMRAEQRRKAIAPVYADDDTRRDLRVLVPA